MNVYAILAILARIQAKLERGEEPTERERVFVTLLWKCVMARLRPIVESLKRAVGASSLRQAELRITGLDVRERRQIAQEVFTRRDTRRRA